jgi:hypothetical protein
VRAEDALALDLLFKHLEGLFDIIVPDENLHAASHFWVPAISLGKGA